MCQTPVIPMCWKCSHVITLEPVGHTGIFEPKDMTGCTANTDIANYEDAKTMCPLGDNHGN